MRVLPPAPVDRQRVGQPLPAGERLGELERQLPALPFVQLRRQGELHLAEQPPVRPLVRVGRLPIGVRGLRGPTGHVARFGVLQLRSVAFVAALALDVVVLRRGRLPAGAAANRCVEVVERHKEILPQAGGGVQGRNAPAALVYSKRNH